MLKRSFCLCFFSMLYIFSQDLLPPPPTQEENIASQEQFQASLSSKQEDKKAISLVYGADFQFLFDNLEDSNPDWATRTLIAASLFPEIGINFFDQNLKIGGYFALNMGEQYPTKWGITLSYDFYARNFYGYFGIFSKQKKIGDYPLLFFREDYDFFHPLIHGVMFQYQSDTELSKIFNLQAEFIFDWYGGDLSKRFDEFLIQGSIRQDFWDKKFFWGASFLLYHTKNDILLNLDRHNFDTYLLDRLYYQAYLGTDLTSIIPAMDKFSFQIGTLSSLERKRRLSRGLDPFSNQLGWQFDTAVQYKGFGFENHLYWGDKQYKYYSQYGEDFYAGIPFYQNTLYNRAELYYEYKNSYIKGRASIILHCTPKGVANQEMISIVLDTEKLLSLLF